MNLKTERSGLCRTGVKVCHSLDMADDEEQEDEEEQEDVEEQEFEEDVEEQEVL